MAIAALFVRRPAAVLPINIEIVTALVMGWLLHRRKVTSTWPSTVALALLYVFVWIGTQVPLDIREFGLTTLQAERLSPRTPRPDLSRPPSSGAIAPKWRDPSAPLRRRSPCDAPEPGGPPLA